jgi:hypothetical protein
VAPRVLYPSDIDGPDPKCVVSILGCTDDWFGGWDGLVPGNADNFITRDLMSGRMVEVIDSGEPAIMVCHWPGIYYNGEKVGFNILKEIKKRLDQKYDHIVWMKLSEISRYWAARELTDLITDRNKVMIKAPFASPGFTVKLNASVRNPAIKTMKGELKQFVRIKDAYSLKAGTWYSDKAGSIICFDLEKGSSEIIIN